MRIVIKNADFSSVSIGKVVKDLSFSFDTDDGVSAINSFFPNYNSGNVQETVWYKGNSGETVTAQSPINTRLVTEFIEVSEGMIIHLKPWGTGSISTPAVVAFDSEKNILSSSCQWWANAGEDGLNFIISSTVKYIKFQASASAVTGGSHIACTGTMPV